MVQKKLGKTTAGTISFATENESVKAYAKPEANGTFPGYVFDTEDPRNKKLEKEVKMIRLLIQLHLICIINQLF